MAVNNGGYTYSAADQNSATYVRTTTATPVCNAGFIPSNTANRTCVSENPSDINEPDSIFNGSPHTCQPIGDCNPLTLQYGSWTYTDFQNRGSVATASCTNTVLYTFIGQNVVTCVSNTTTTSLLDSDWSEVPGSCQPNDPCILPTTPNVIYNPAAPPRPRGTSITGTCANGYVQTGGSTTRTCVANTTSTTNLLDSQWDGTEMICQPAPW